MIIQSYDNKNMSKRIIILHFNINNYLSDSHN